MQTLRVLKIKWILLRYGLDEIILKLPAFASIRYIFYLFPWNWLRHNRVSLAIRIRLALEDLGPIFVKFGQALSTRRDLLPTEFADELAKLQDRVPPFPGKQAWGMIEKALGQPIEDIFSKFEEEPLASASIAQVHTATLKSGEDVVVKVLRPGVEKQIRGDLKILYLFARALHRWLPYGKYLRPIEVVAEYEKTILNELDLMREAANASQLRRNFENSDMLYVPQIYWPYCHRNVIVMERIYGISISDISGLKQAQINLKKLSEKGVEIFFTQVFEHNFFHADMHPGNIFVASDNPENPKYLGVDFGIIGTLSLADQAYLAENFLAFFRNDYRRVAELHIESGWVPKDTRIDELEDAVRTVCEPVFQKPLKEISFAQVLMRLLQTARQFNMEVQPQLILLQKTLFNIEGLGRELYPELDLWKTAKPFLENWMAKRVGVRSTLTQLHSHLSQAMNMLPQIPELIAGRQKQYHEAQLKAEYRNQELRKEIRHLGRNIIITVLIIGTAIIVALLW